MGGPPTAGSQFPIRDERSALVFLAEPVVLQGNQHRVGVAVVQFADVDVLQCDACHLEGLCSGLFGPGIDAWLMICALIVARRPLPHTEYVDRWLLEAPGSLSGGDDNGNTAIGDQAAVEQVEGLRDEARILMLF